MPSVNNLKEGTHWEFIKLLMRKRQKVNSVHLLQKRPKRAEGKMCCSELRFCDFLRERKHFLSRIPADRTVGFFWTKKQSGSTQRGLRVGTGFGEF